jgi:hypothetical protein
VHFLPITVQYEEGGGGEGQFTVAEENKSISANHDQVEEIAKQQQQQSTSSGHGQQQQQQQLLINGDQDDEMTDLDQSNQNEATLQSTYLLIKLLSLRRI